MPTCAYLSMDSLDGFVSDDALTYAPLRRLGWSVEAVPWRAQRLDWGRFDIVVIRTPWDYQDDVAAFLDVLAAIDRSPARLENGLDLVRWNVEKTYLRDLERHGIPIVPTRWGEALEPASVDSFFDTFDADELILKPVVSANADHTYRLARADWARHAGTLAGVFERRPFMAQPFLRRVLDEGEVSLFYFGGAYSHAIRKVPKPGDFRVQEEHGGDIQPLQPTPDLRALGQAVMDALGQTPLYARADFVRDARGDARLMELELVEPALYFRMDPGSPERFARTLVDWLRGD